MTSDRLNEIECRLSHLHADFERLRAFVRSPMVDDACQLARDARELLAEVRRARAALDALR